MRYNKAVVLKDNAECLIRNAKESDAECVYNNYILTHEETDFLLIYPDESSISVAREKEFLLLKENSKNEIELCAFVGGNLAGTAGISNLGAIDKVRHRAELGISILKAYWNRGIGRALTEACIECARQAGYLQLELTVVSSNVAAVELYKKVGFVEYGRNPRGFRTRNQEWQEVILMRLELD